MKKTAEQKIVLKVQGKITRVSIIDGGTSVEVYSISDSNQEYIEKLIYIEKPYCFHFNMQNSKISYFITILPMSYIINQKEICHNKSSLCNLRYISM